MAKSELCSGPHAERYDAAGKQQNELVWLKEASQYVMARKPPGQSTADEPSKSPDANAEREYEAESKGTLPLVCQLRDRGRKADGPR